MEIAEQEIQDEIFSFSTLFLVDNTMDQPSLFHVYKTLANAEGKFSIINCSQIVGGTKIFLAVWQMQRKCDIMTQEAKKWKTCLNFNGSKMKRGIHYDHSYAPVILCSSIQSALVITTANNWVSTRWATYLLSPKHPQNAMSTWRFHGVMKWVKANPRMITPCSSNPVYMAKNKQHKCGINTSPKAWSRK